MSLARMGDVWVSSGPQGLCDFTKAAELLRGGWTPQRPPRSPLSCGSATNTENIGVGLARLPQEGWTRAEPH